MEAKETAEVFEEFVASFEETESSGKTFVRGSSSIKPAATGMIAAAKCDDVLHYDTSSISFVCVCVSQWEDV